MDVSRILSEIDAEIARLQSARAAIAGISGSSVGAAAPARRRGRPKGSKNAASVPAKVTGKKKRVLSPDARKRIADAQKRRWAERRKEQAKK